MCETEGKRGRGGGGIEREEGGQREVGERGGEQREREEGGGEERKEEEDREVEGREEEKGREGGRLVVVVGRPAEKRRSREPKNFFRAKKTTGHSR